MNIYLAAPWVCREDAQAARVQFEAAGIHVTSHWITRHVNPGANENPATLAAEAIEDVADLHAADAFVLLAFAKSEGKACELGMAIERGLRTIIVGWGDNFHCMNVFYYLPTSEHVATVQEAINALHRA